MPPVAPSVRLGPAGESTGGEKRGRPTRATLVLVGCVCAYGEEELAGVVDDDEEEEFEDVAGLLGCAL